MTPPVKYSQDVCKKLIDHMSSGKNFTSFHQVINVSPSVLTQWEIKHPEFLEAKQIAFQRRKDFFEQKYIDIAFGIDPNSKEANPYMLTFIMKNINHWAEKLDKKVEANGEIQYKITYDTIESHDDIKEIDYEEVDDESSD